MSWVWFWFLLWVDDFGSLVEMGLVVLFLGEGFKKLGFILGGEEIGSEFEELGLIGLVLVVFVEYRELGLVLFCFGFGLVWFCY